MSLGLEVGVGGVAVAVAVARLAGLVWVGKGVRVGAMDGARVSDPLGVAVGAGWTTTTCPDEVVTSSSIASWLAARTPCSISAVVPLPLNAWRKEPFRTGSWRAARELITELRATQYELAVDLQGLIKSASLARVTAKTIS